MVKKSDNDVVAVMNKIQAQLAVLDRKLDAFMTKSLTELAQAKAAAEKKPQPMPQPQHSAPRPMEPRPGRQMFAIVCFECGKDAELPFKPSGDRPVYCQECFAKKRAAKNTNPKLQSAPQAISIAPAGNITSTPVAEPAKGKKKVAAKKAPAKKKVVAKKTAKRK